MATRRSHTRFITALLVAEESRPEDAGLPSAPMLKRLMSDHDPNAKELREWLKRRHGEEPDGLEIAHALPIGYLGSQEGLPLRCDRWEGALMQFAEFMSHHPSLSTWDVTPGKDRPAHTRRVAKAARALADVLEEESRPDYPPLLALFNDDDALRLAELMPTQKNLIAGTRLVHNKLSSELRTPAQRLAFVFKMTARSRRDDEPHQLPDILRRLAAYAEKARYARTPVTRPRTGHSKARVFAQHMHDYLMERYGAPLDRINILCIAVKYPDIQDLPDERTIQGWTGRK